MLTFPAWKVSVSHLLCATHGDPVATIKLIVWGISMDSLLPFDPPLINLVGSEPSEPLVSFLDTSLNTPANTLCNMNCLLPIVGNKHDTPCNDYQPYPIATFASTRPTRDLILDTRFPGMPDTRSIFYPL